MKTKSPARGAWYKVVLPLISLLMLGGLALLAGCRMEDPVYTITLIQPSAGGSLTARVGSGPASGGVIEAEPEEKITLTATAANSYNFVRYTYTGLALDSGSGSVRTFTMPRHDVTVTAIFSSAGGGGPDDPDPPNPPGSFVPTQAHEGLGVYVYDRNPAGVEFFADWVGLDVKYAEDFLGYDGWQSYTGEWWSDFNPRFWEGWKASNPEKRLILSVSPFPKTGISAGGYDGAMTAKARQNYQDAAAGNFNSYYQQLGEKLKALGLGDTIIRFGHEMSGSWYIYSIVAGSTEEIKQEKQTNYGLAFNQFAETLKAIPGTNFEFCWNPAADADPAVLTRSYPGDEHVDYIAFDQYDYYLSTYNNGVYHTSTDQAYRRGIQMQAWNYMMRANWGTPTWFASFAKQHNKPLAIAEWGLWRDNPNSGYDNPYFIEKMYEWILDNDVVWHTYFMFGDVSHSLFDTIGYPLASAKFQELWNPQGSPQVTPAIPPSAVSGYNAAKVKRGRDATFGDRVALISDPWAWSGGIMAGMWTRQDDFWTDNITITFENCPASTGFALVYQLWHSNLSNNEEFNNQRVSLYVNGTPVQSAINLQHGGRGWGDSYMVETFDVAIPAGASVMFKADTGNWAYTRLNFDYLIFK